MEEICSRCKHSRQKCVETVDMRTGRECSCNVKYMDKGMFVIGTPKKEY